MHNLRMMAFSFALLVSACAHDMQAPTQSPNNVVLCVPYSDDGKSPHSGEPRIRMQRVTDPAADQPVIVIRTSAESAGKIAGSKWFLANPHFEFQGEAYFLGPLNVRSLQLPAGVIATLVPTGTVDGVTVYAHETVEAEKRKVLAVRAYTDCDIQWYLHVSLIRN